MTANPALSAANSGDALQRFIGIHMLKSVADTQKSEVSLMLQDFAQNQTNIRQAAHPTIGKTLDIKV